MSFTSSSIWSGRTHKALVGAVAAMAFGLVGCGGGSDEPDARIPGTSMRDAAVPQPAATHSGTVSVTDLTALDSDGNAVAKGGSITLSFTPISTLQQCSATQGAPCQLGTTPVASCLTRITPIAAQAVATADVGTITITASEASATTDSGSGTGDEVDEWNPTPAFPLCSIRGGQYQCISLEGTGGTVQPLGTGKATFEDFTIGDAGPSNVVTDDDITRTLAASANNVLLSLPIVGASAGSLTVVSGTLAAPFNAQVWRVIHGGGPVPLALPGDPFPTEDVTSFQFLNDSDKIKVKFPGAASGPFGAQDKDIEVGDVFTLTTESLDLIKLLDSNSEIEGITEFTLGCDECGAEGNAAGTLIVLDATTATERIVTQCSAVGQDEATIAAAHWAEVTKRAEDLAITSMQVTVFRPGLSTSEEKPPRAKNGVNYLAGHGFVARRAPVTAD
jgi:hypothetical protein